MSDATIPTEAFDEAHPDHDWWVDRTGRCLAQHQHRWHVDHTTLEHEAWQTARLAAWVAEHPAPEYADWERRALDRARDVPDHLQIKAELRRNGEDY